MPAVAGRFYPADPGQCRGLAESYVKVGEENESGGVGGVVPHAGWICSGAIAGEVIGTLAKGTSPDLVVVFGAVHTPVDLRFAALDSHATWQMPGGDCYVARSLGESLERDSNAFATDDRLHMHEHAVEVEVPLIRAAWPEAELLPVEVPAIDNAAEIGQRTAQFVLDKGHKAVFLASSDLTHYGPSYRFTPVGVGVAALNWAKENDRRLLGMIERFEIARIVPEVRGHYNACGAGAIAAMMAACKVAGAGSARVLRHASSYETLAQVAPQRPVDAVGYAAVVVR
jgi:AmmeMemoRadiSam system protein B